MSDSNITPCILAWTHLFVSSDGRTGPCCNIFNWGDIHQGVESVFHGAEAVKLRQAMVEGNLEDLHPSCRNCHNLRRLGERNEFSWFFQLQADWGAGLTRFPEFLQNHRWIETAWEQRSVELPGDSRPLHLTVQLGERCNLRCPMCFQSHLPAADLPRDVLPALQELLPYVQMLIMTGGEPLVYDEFWKLAAEYSAPARPGAFLGILTNGLLLTRERLERELAGLDRFGVAFSLDAATRETYEKLRIPGRWEVAQKNLGDFSKFCQEHNKNDWGMTISFVVMNSNIHELADAIRMAAGLPAGLGCGPVTGKNFPESACRTYLQENLFEFSHLGWSRDELIAALEPALIAVKESFPAEQQAPFRDNILALQEYARTVERVNIPPADLPALLTLSDHELAVAVGEYMQQVSVSGFNPTGSGFFSWMRSIRRFLRF